MVSNIQAKSGPVERVYDPKITFRPVKIDPYAKGATLSTQAQKAKKVWGQQKSYIYDENPQQLSQEQFQPEKVLLKAIPNQDGRERITETAIWPNALHAQLTMKFNGQIYGGSGAMVGPHHLLTCGHNVYDSALKQWAEEITAYPALNESHAPFGKVRVVRVYTFSNWVDQGDEKYDIALLILNLSVGKFTGWAGLLCTGDRELSQEEEVNIVGYPGDKGSKQMWGMTHKIQKITPEGFEYLIDTNSGQSGSAIWIDKFGTPMILGVHTRGGDYTNCGVRISQDKFKEIVQRISETYKLEKTDPALSASSGLQQLTIQAPPQPAAPAATSFSQPSIPSSVPPQPIDTISAQSKVLSALPSFAFGAADWMKYIGDVGVEPPLPPDIEAILNAPCPFWPPKKVRDTHMLVLVPQTVNGKPLTLKALGELVQNPLQGHATGYRNFNLGEYNDPPAPKSHWALLTQTVIEGSRNQRYKNGNAVLDSYSQKAQIPYEAPTVLDAAVCLFMEYVRSRIWVYRDSPSIYRNCPPTYTFCQEIYRNSWHLIVGGGSAEGLFLGSFVFSFFDADKEYGVGGLRKW